MVRNILLLLIARAAGSVSASVTVAATGPRSATERHPQPVQDPPAMLLTDSLDYELRDTLLTYVVAC